MARKPGAKPELRLVESGELPPDPEADAQAVAPDEVRIARVRGEPVTQLPKDLYIPPQALEVVLATFEGPLDLLLYLIRRQNLDILDIPLADITRQYMQYIELMQELQLELVAEYLVMAATLAEIKSRMLLPRPKSAADGSGEDPRAELVRRLQEYERFKAAAVDLDKLERLERDVWVAGAELRDRPVVRTQPQITLREMLLAFKEVLGRSEMFAAHHIRGEPLSVRARMGDILTTLEHSAFVDFVRLFKPGEGRGGVVVTFIAILELSREGLIEIVQTGGYAPLHVRGHRPQPHLHLVGAGEHAAEASAGGDSTDALQPLEDWDEEDSDGSEQEGDDDIDRRTPSG